MDFLILLVMSFTAAFFGTMFMTVSQEIEIRLRRRSISHSPAVAVFKILHLDFNVLSKHAKVFWSYATHFAYGTFWGWPLALFVFFNIPDPKLVLAVYYIVILVQGWTVLPLVGIMGPPWTWGIKSVLIEMVHKAVFAAVTVAVFSLLLS